LLCGGVGQETFAINTKIETLYIDFDIQYTVNFLCLMDLRRLTDTFDKWITLVYSSKLDIIYKGMANYEKHCIYFVDLIEIHWNYQES
jgi:hypothetical protein